MFTLISDNTLFIWYNMNILLIKLFLSWCQHPCLWWWYRCCSWWWWFLQCLGDAQHTEIDIPWSLVIIRAEIFNVFLRLLVKYCHRLRNTHTNEKNMLLHIVLVFKNIFSHNVEILYYFQNPTQILISDTTKRLFSWKKVSNVRKWFICRW